MASPGVRCAGRGGKGVRDQKERERGCDLPRLGPMSKRMRSSLSSLLEAAFDRGSSRSTSRSWNNEMLLSIRGGPPLPADSAMAC